MANWIQFPHLISIHDTMNRPNTTKMQSINMQPACAHHRSKVEASLTLIKRTKKKKEKEKKEDWKKKWMNKRWRPIEEFQLPRWRNDRTIARLFDSVSSTKAELNWKRRGQVDRGGGRGGREDVCVIILFFLYLFHFHFSLIRLRIWDRMYRNIPITLTGSADEYASNMNFKISKKKKKKKKSINRYAAFWYQTIVEEKMGEGEEGGKEWSFYKDSFTNLRFN